MKYLLLVLLQSTLIAWFMLFLTRSGIRDYVERWLDNKKTRFAMLLADLVECDFCFCWWLNVACAILAAVVFRDAWLLALMFVCTPISRKLL